ncbi:CPBP family intramembrane glutamic endopeptidase [Natrialba swarupiae]|uniref:CPBP family intramembrane metalloprotease n=1 Tax=Natrialba swarupiae TaxID=2448032 RepID=A0A5D5AHF8_9EURY|nr:type II CAAX endopeptidase family protein [Natrialba swarupiae]TYT60564.1 CPBP family intramembrane metalloprotease [Natrialba swarupiae]
MPQWVTFVAVTGVVLVSLLVLSHLSQSAFADGDSESAGDGRDDPPRSTDLESTDSNSSAAESGPHRSVPKHGEPHESEPSRDDEYGREDRTDARGRPPSGEGVDPASLSTGALLANVAISQGLFALVLLGAVVYTGIPADALGIEFSRSYVEQGILWGTVAGILLYVSNEVGASVATRFGFDHDEQLRELLAPGSVQGWIVLLVLVLPIIAVFEELLFRAALIGVVSAGFDVSPWLLAVVSSIAFAVGHGIQGSVGIVVTGLLGFVLAAVFIVTGSFLVVVVAHYLINALEFVVHERFDLEWASSLER